MTIRAVFLILALSVGLAQQALPPDTPVHPIYQLDPIVAERNLESRVEPVYPEAARMGRVQGIVRLAVVIGENGLPQHIRTVSGPAMLREAAMTAVQKWVYRPFFRNGRNVAVEIEIDVPFRLE